MTDPHHEQLPEPLVFPLIRPGVTVDRLEVEPSRTATARADLLRTMILGGEVAPRPTHQELVTTGGEDYDRITDELDRWAQTSLGGSLARLRNPNDVGQNGNEHPSPQHAEVILSEETLAKQDEIFRGEIMRGFATAQTESAESADSSPYQRPPEDDPIYKHWKGIGAHFTRSREVLPPEEKTRTNKKDQPRVPASPEHLAALQHKIDMYQRLAVTDRHPSLGDEEYGAYITNLQANLDEAQRQLTEARELGVETTETVKKPDSSTEAPKDVLGRVLGRLKKL